MSEELAVVIIFNVALLLAVAYFAIKKGNEDDRKFGRTVVLWRGAKGKGADKWN